MESSSSSSGGGLDAVLQLSQDEKFKANLVEKYPITVPRDGLARRRMTLEMRRWLERHSSLISSETLPSGLSFRVGVICNVECPPRVNVSRNTLPGEWDPSVPGSRDQLIYQPESLSFEVWGLVPATHEEGLDLHAIDQLQQLAMEMEFSHVGVIEGQFEIWKVGREVKTSAIQRDGVMALHCQKEDLDRLKNQHPDHSLAQLARDNPFSFYQVPYAGFQEHLAGTQPLIDPSRHHTGKWSVVLRIPNLDLDANSDRVAEYVRHFSAILHQLNE